MIVTWKHADLSNGGLFSKSLVPMFRRIYALSVGFKIKTLRKGFWNIKTKTNSNFTVKVTERSNHTILLFTWWIMFFRHLYDNGIKELNWLCKHMKNVRSSYPCISMSFCTEFTKAQVSLIFFAMFLILGEMIFRLTIFNTLSHYCCLSSWLPHF